MRERRIFFLFDFSAVLGYNYLIKPRRNSMNNDIRTEEQETVSGIVDSIIYQNEDNGYARCCIIGVFREIKDHRDRNCRGF